MTVLRLPGLRLLLLTALLATDPPAHGAERPNIIFILSDDLGYGDVGCFFQNQRQTANDRSLPCEFTPQLDRMAAEGLQLRDHYCSAPVCAPSRASLLLGVHQGHANVRDNQFDKALENNHTIATVLKSAGYATAAFGKWGLQGGPGEKDPAGAKAGPEHWPAYPTKRGFDFYCGYVRHQDGHWHYPKEDKRQVWENEREISAGLDGCYTADLFTARAKKWITEQRAAHPEQPFMTYVAFDTPHAKTQYPPCAYPAGGGARGGVQWLGTPGHMLNTDGQPDTWCHPDYANATWDDDHDPATAEKPWPDVYRRYASAVRRIDDCVGDLLQLLKDLGIDQNTLVVFTSDNGVSMESYLKEPFSPQFFHSFGPFDGIKRDCWEGGVRVGAVARWPGTIPPGRVSHQPSAHYDWLPTFAELAGLPAPARADGVSLVPTLRGAGEQKTKPIYIEYFQKGKTPAYPEFLAAHRGRERDQMQAIRIGDLMGVRYDIASATEPFEIYNVMTDPQQAKNLATASLEYAAIQQQMQNGVRWMRRPDPDAKRPYDQELAPAEHPEKVAPGVEWRSYEQASPWVARLDDVTPTRHSVQSRPIIVLPPVLRPGTQARDFSMLFTGYLKVPADGEYTFHLKADKGALLRIHDATVIDADFGYQPGTEKSGAIRLQAGLHSFRLYYAHRGSGTPTLEWQWSRPASPKEEIPTEAFVYATGTEAAK
jgi:arylsulfatase A-like enzyme